MSAADPVNPSLFREPEVDISDDFAIALALQEEENNYQAATHVGPPELGFNYSYHSYNEEGNADESECSGDYSDMEGDYEDHVHAAMMTHAGVSLHDDENQHRVRRMIIHESLYDQALQAEQAYLNKGVAISRNCSVVKAPARTAEEDGEVEEASATPSKSKVPRRRRSDLLRQVKETREAGKDKYCFTLHRNANQSEVKTLRCSLGHTTSLKDFLKLANNRFHKSGKKFVKVYLKDGSEITDPAQLSNYADLYLSSGESFVG
eukprot:TRINITY_DN3140_c0_g1_i1.p1 TRINITY_DN3140_c0_g1~~TRINITY_DN3140_c0_g1_i1.p1  ORF type:complete len:263 (+),score=73.39 TRINITY_DN3140_c0_g1_i1:351-1139(+)